MKYKFNKIYYSLALQPGIRLLLIGVFCTCVGLISFSVVWELATIAIALVVLFWQRLTRQEVGENFIALRSMPILDGKPYYFIGQQAQKGAKHKQCRTLQYSLLRDKAALEQLPSGIYKTITHDGVLNVLRSSNRIQLISVTPAYKADLRSILRMQSGKRCRRCKSRCKAWNSPPRQFYVVEFTIP